MNSREITELRRRFHPDNTNLTCLRGCYVNSKHEIVSLFHLSPVSLPTEECEKYLSLLKKTLSGIPGKNLVDVPFSPQQVGVDDAHRLLTALRDTGLEDDDLVQVFFQRTIDSLPSENSYLILLGHDVYDVPFRSGEGVHSLDAGDTVHRYIVCAVCPVKLTKPALAYCAQDNLFHPSDADWVAGAVDMGFVFPAFDERRTNIYSALTYTRDPADAHEAFIDAVLGTPAPMPPKEQQTILQSLLEESLKEECSLEVVQRVHEQLSERVEEQKKDRDAAPLQVSSGDISRALAVCGVPTACTKAFEQAYAERLGAGTQLSAVNVMDVKQFEVRTPSVVIKVDPARSDLLETRMINGSRYILIRAEEGVEVNGVNITIQQG